MQNLTEVAVICELRRKGFSLQGVRKVMRFLDREVCKPLAEIVSRTSDVHLLTDGTHLYLETSGAANRRYPKKFQSANSRRLSQRRRPSGARRRDRQKVKYFRNSAGPRRRRARKVS